MKRNFFTATALLFLSLGAQAGLIDQGITTLDDVSGLEWLDLTETLDLSVASIQSGAGGFLAAGWSVAGLSEICSLYGNIDSFDGAACAAGFRNSHHYNSTGTSYRFGPDASIPAIVDLLGDTWVSRTPTWTLGTFLGSRPGTAGWACMFADGGCTATGSPGGFLLDNYFSTTAFHRREAGVYLYRAASVSVPEPATLALLGLGFAGLGVARRRKT